VASINSGRYGKGLKASIVDLGRPELIKCFFEADLFVFASKIEYSPLVLFEAAAAGLPFLTTPVGNAYEIVQWTSGGRICDSLTDANGYASVDPIIFAKEIELMINQEGARIEMKLLARENWKKYFTWSKLVGDYEKVLMGATTINDRRFEMDK
jgi:glycosyltransferase involved in cell wall biosynthesis